MAIILGIEDLDCSRYDDAAALIDRCRSGALLCQMIETVTGKKTRHAHSEAAVRRSSFFARENIMGFLEACREMGVPEPLLFSPEDLVSGRNESVVVKCLLAVAEAAARKHGVKPPRVVALQMEIDKEEKGTVGEDESSWEDVFFEEDDSTNEEDEEEQDDEDDDDDDDDEPPPGISNRKPFSLKTSFRRPSRDVFEEFPWPQRNDSPRVATQAFPPRPPEAALPEFPHFTSNPQNIVSSPRRRLREARYVARGFLATSEAMRTKKKSFRKINLARENLVETGLVTVFGETTRAPQTRSRVRQKHRLKNPFAAELESETPYGGLRGAPPRRGPPGTGFVAFPSPPMPRADSFSLEQQERLRQHRRELQLAAGAGPGTEPVGVVPSQPKDTVDAAVRRLLRRNAYLGHVRVRRVRSGVYLLGESAQRVHVRELRGVLMARVGGGWATLSDLLAERLTRAIRADEKARMGTAYGAGRTSAALARADARSARVRADLAALRVAQNQDDGGGVGRARALFADAMTAV
jgi:hypothetical protein